jgi:hypothetical protein
MNQFDFAQIASFEVGEHETGSREFNGHPAEKLYTLS